MDFLFSSERNILVGTLVPIGVLTVVTLYIINYFYRLVHPDVNYY